MLSEVKPLTVLEYDSDSLTTNLELRVGRGRISLGIANALELPEHELPGGFLLDEAVLLTEELTAFEVDTGNERMFSLTFSVDW